MSKGKSAIDDHLVSITGSVMRGLYWWHCGCGKSGEGTTYTSNQQSTADAYNHVKWALQPSGNKS